MSPSQEFTGEAPPVERRFYSRAIPHAPIYLAIDGSEDTLLLNVSENGLLVSAPVVLPVNLVARVAIPLTGLPKPVQVSVRVIWCSEERKQAGIQLLDLGEHDREQIRKWNTRESSQFLHRQTQTEQPSVAPVFAAKPRIVPPATTPTVSAAAQSRFNPKTGDKAPVAARPTSPEIASEVTTSPAARYALWGMAITALCLAALFLLKSNALGNSFGRSREILYGNGAPVPAQPSPPDAATADYVSPKAALASASAEKPTPISAGDSSPGASSRADGNVFPGRAANEEESSANTDVSDEEQPDTPPPTKPQSSAPASRTLMGAGTANSPSSSPVPGPDAASRNNSPAPIPSAGSGTAERLPPPPPITSQTAGNSFHGNELPPATAPSVSAVIQMDTPARQVMEIRAQRGYRGAFFDLPGERVLETSSVTIHIQRSVRMPSGHSVLPFHPFGRSKKVVIGGLISRVDPQLEQAQLRSGDFLRVSATIDENGRVESVRPVVGRSDLVPVVLKAVQEWRYQPTLVDDKPVETKADVLIQFHNLPR